MSDRLELWNRLASLLRTVLGEIQQDLGEDDRELIQDFIENNEYGVAFDWLTAIKSNRSLEISLNALNALVELESLLGPPSDRD